ncbi:MAG TPA: ABC transporter family substrate-binding protein [Pseudonocardia sp.]|nr:ABC transporter family substrate-binding protein [Pseudonocardia sp.]
MTRARLLLVALVTLLAAATGTACSNEPVTGSQPAPTPTQKAEPTSLTVAIGDLPRGFNPHLLADRSAVTTALATLVLPSPFTVAPDGVLQLDPTIVTSAKVVDSDPFTVSYELNLEASWSDNAPIAAEDFVYLWQQMRGQPGVAGAAGYQLITDVRSRAGGKAVDVVFSQPYPAWQQLFSGLLPAHLLKDAPGSWIGATAGGLPTSGGPFKVATVDRGRGEIVLTRNDAYWDTPTVLDQLVLRRLAPSSMTAGLATGDVDVAIPEADRVVRAAMTGLNPEPHIQQSPQSSVTQLAMRADGGPMRDVRVREALAMLVDRDALRAAVAPEALPADALGLAPSQPGYASTAPSTVKPNPAGAAQLLTAAGWKRDVVTGRWDTADGRAARVVISAAAERPDDVRVAEAVATQLTAAGVDTLVIAPAATDLFAQPTVAPTPPSPRPSATPTPTPTPTSTATTAGVAADVIVTPRAVGGDLGTELASTYGCQQATAQLPDPPRSPTGFCFPALQPLFAELMSAAPRADTAATVERILWQQMPVLPLFQPVTLVVSTAESDAATSIGPGSLLGGPLTGASRWRPTAR